MIAPRKYRYLLRRFVVSLQCGIGGQIAIAGLILFLVIISHSIPE